MADDSDGTHSTDPGEVLAALGFPTATATVPQTGYDATVWRADLADGRTVAIRLLRPDVHPDRELAALHLAAEYGHPAPRLLGNAVVAGRAALVMTWCPGQPIGELLAEGGGAADLGEPFGRAQARLHRRMDDGTVLCHLDYQPFNVLAEDGEITGIVDWSNARAGDPAEDVATTAVVLAIAPAVVPELADGLDEFTAAWRSGYAEVRTFPDDNHLAPFLAHAARLQLDTWRPRAAASACEPAVLARAEAIAARCNG